MGRLGNYRVLRLLGQGGMGFVFQAKDLTLGRAVALKVQKSADKFGEEMRQRFLREARLMASIKHAHVATVYQAGQTADVVYLALELLEGETLETCLRRVPPPPAAECLRLARQIAAGLRVIHERGLVHRDLKPANIWLEAPDGRAKILDFGLARHVEDDGQLTEVGTIIGTPAYMSPEQARGRFVDARSDLFSLGSVLYRLCTGAEPFAGPTTTAILTALAVDTPRPVHDRNARVPQALSKLIAELLAKRPEDRPATAERVLQHLNAIDGTADAAHPEPAAPRRRWACAALLLFAVVAGGGLGLAYWRPWQSAPVAGPAPTAPTSPRAEIIDYLKDLTPFASAHWPLPRSPRGDIIKDPYETISIDGKPSPRGIGMHPSHEGPASASYHLVKRYSRFRGAVSLNDSVAWSNARMVFSVYGDGKLLWRSLPVGSRRETQEFDVAVAGTEILKLEVGCSDKAHGAHGVWVEPRLTREEGGNEKK